MVYYIYIYIYICIQTHIRTLNAVSDLAAVALRAGGVAPLDQMDDQNNVMI